MDRLAKAFFLLSSVTLAVLFGSFGAVYNWFPHPQIRSALEGWFELTANWRNDLQLEPTRHLVPAAVADTPAFVMHDAAAAMPGHTLVAGLAPGRERLQGATLYDGEGREIHHWPFDYEALDPDGPNEFNVMVHGVAAFEDGSLVVAFDAGKALARIDACGAPLWVSHGSYHHAVNRAEDGSLWTWRDESIVNVDGESGAEISAFDFRKDVIVAQDLYGELGMRTLEDSEKVRWFEDPFHANDVEPLDTAMAAAYPMFEPGDLLISLRELNLVGVIDPATKRLKWSQIGPWFKQHDPDFGPDGLISVYDNRMGLGASRLLAHDPATGETTALLESTTATPFYSWRRGKHQRLANGNVLVTESERGRVFEASADGRLVWERRQVYDGTRNAIVTSAEHLPADFFEPGAFDCAEPAKEVAGSPSAVPLRTAGTGRSRAPLPNGIAFAPEPTTALQTPIVERAASPKRRPAWYTDHS